MHTNLSSASDFRFSFGLWNLHPGAKLLGPPELVHRPKTIFIVPALRGQR